MLQLDPSNDEQLTVLESMMGSTARGTIDRLGRDEGQCRGGGVP